MQKNIHFVRDPADITILANFVQREILQLLAEGPMTETQLSRRLGVTKSAIGYRLKQLRKANLIYLEKEEAERHGIIQKFYRSIASLIIASYDQTPDRVKRYFIQMQIEHLIGMLAAMQSSRSHFFDVHSDTIEQLAILVWKQLEQTGKKYEKGIHVGDADSFRISVYTDVLNALTTHPEWKALLPVRF